ncbi:hypothetical protein [Amycolatopsis alba]|uniref:Uncharacterized protein n=1 Tax=Amycolatopsis alba DSM 44262 TaxID=1125972 RepID=A0A229RK78_AMYAL|nr:hypothetical protein [Amycolatopsis alba]OXM47043.1 hypothetical protein CFP75_25545 [Amycolatopsis alba DSM 44262]
MTARTFVPPGYLSYRVAVIAIVAVLLLAAAFVVAAWYPELKDLVLSWVNGVRAAWTEMNWQAV